MTMTATPRREFTRRQWSTTAVAAVLVLGAGLGYVIGRPSGLHTETVRCLSAEGTIGCTLGDGWDIAIPTDVPWTDSTGSFHDHGRPDCLPPTGRGLEDPVEITWTKVEADGVGWRQVVWVGC